MGVGSEEGVSEGKMGVEYTRDLGRAGSAQPNAVLLGMQLFAVRADRLSEANDDALSLCVES